MKTAWITRRPTKTELEKFRLILSLISDPVFGRKWNEDGVSYPDTEFHEEAHPIAFGGFPVRSKAIFDTLVPVPGAADEHYGIQLKIRGEKKTDKRLYLEWSNAASRDHRACRAAGISADDLENHKADASIAGRAILKKIQEDHDNSATNHKRLPAGHSIRTNESKTVHLTWQIDEKGCYYWLHSFPHDLPDIRIWRYADRADSRSIRGYESELHRKKDFLR